MSDFSAPSARQSAENDAPQRWRKKPVVIEAWQVTPVNRYDVAEWCGGWAEHPAISGTVYAPGLLSIETLEGKMWAAEGDYVIRGVKGEFYPCKPDIFEATYEAEHIDGPVASKAPAQRGQQVPGGNHDTVRVRGGRGASGEQLPGGNLAGQADHSDGPESLAERHQRHWQTCNCLADKAICCDPACPCHEPSDTECLRCGDRIRVAGPLHVCDLTEPGGGALIDGSEGGG